MYRDLNTLQSCIVQYVHMLFIFTHCNFGLEKCTKSTVNCIGNVHKYSEVGFGVNQGRFYVKICSTPNVFTRKTQSNMQNGFCSLFVPKLYRDLPPSM